ncbi:unnamed protein product, partial [Tenebrio molitor]
MNPDLILDHQTVVRRCGEDQGERYSQCCIYPRSGYTGGSIMIWAGIFLEAHTDLVFVENG